MRPALVGMRSRAREPRRKARASWPLLFLLWTLASLALVASDARMQERAWHVASAWLGAGPSASSR